MVKNKIPTSFLITNNGNTNSQYQGALSHLGIEKEYPYTWAKEPEFLFAIGVTVGKGALIIFRTILHHSNKQIFGMQFPPVAGSPEYVRLSPTAVNKYGLSKTSRIHTIRLLERLGFIECQPKRTENCAPICRIAKGVLEYDDLTFDDETRNKLKAKIKIAREAA